MAIEKAHWPCSLFDLLSNDLILRHTSPYIGIRSLVLLAATSKAYKSLLYNTLQVFQHVDLSGTAFFMPSATELPLFIGQERFATFFSTLENRNVLQDVRTLILDNLFVPTAVIDDIMCNERYQVRLLSLRGVSKPEPHDMLRILRHSVKPSPLKETPRVRALYLFGLPSRNQELLNVKDIMTRPASITASIGAQLGAGSHMTEGLDDFGKLLGDDPYSDSPYGAAGLSYVLGGGWVASEWSEILEAYAGLIAFDAVLCRHNQQSVPDSRPRLANVRLSGCKSCGTCPEGPAYPGVSPVDHLPLLSPPPLHSSKVEVAQRIGTQGQAYPPLIVRCRICLKDRWCEVCNAWWCESCYTVPKNRNPTQRDPVSSLSGPALNEEIKVHNGLCVSKCLMEVLLNGVGEGGMWG